MRVKKNPLLAGSTRRQFSKQINELRNSFKPTNNFFCSRSYLATCIWALICIQFFLASCSSDASTVWQEKLKKCSQENKFTCLLVSSGKISEDKIMREALQKFTGKRHDKTAIIEVDFKKEQKNLEKFFKVKLKEPPVALVIAPNGAVTGDFDKDISEKKLEQSLVSPEEADLFLPLQQGKAVFLCFYKQQSKELARVKSELGAIEKFFKGWVVAQYHNLSDVSGAALLKKLPPFNHDAVTVLTLLPPGQLKSKLEGNQIKRVNLLKAFQGGCCPSGGAKGGKDCK